MPVMKGRLVHERIVVPLDVRDAREGANVDTGHPADLPAAKGEPPAEWDSAENGLVLRRSRLPREADFIDTASDDSFPASDAPTWATGRARCREAPEATPDTPDR